MFETFMWNDARYRVLATDNGGIIHIDQFKYESENIVYHKVGLMISEDSYQVQLYYTRKSSVIQVEKVLKIPGSDEQLPGSQYLSRLSRQRANKALKKIKSNGGW